MCELRISLRTKNNGLQQVYVKKWGNGRTTTVYTVAVPCTRMAYGIIWLCCELCVVFCVIPKVGLISATVYIHIHFCPGIRKGNPGFQVAAEVIEAFIAADSINCRTGAWWWVSLIALRLTRQQGCGQA